MRKLYCIFFAFITFSCSEEIKEHKSSNDALFSYLKTQLEDTLYITNPNLISFDCVIEEMTFSDFEQGNSFYIKNISQKINSDTLLINFSFPHIGCLGSPKGNFELKKDTLSLFFHFNSGNEPCEELVEYSMSYKIHNPDLNVNSKYKLEFIGRIGGRTTNFTKENRVNF